MATRRLAGWSTATSLKARSIRSSAWTTAEFGIAQVLRLASNITLAHVLGNNSREAFGLMMFVGIWMSALEMFSDIGIGPSIIQNPRGDEPRYLNTAWTIQVIRGFALWIGSALLAYPVSIGWDEPALLYLLPIVGVIAAINGFNSTSLFTLNRNLTVGKVVLLNLGRQVITVIVMVAWAWIHPTVWALVAGAIVGALTTMVVSHLLVRPTNRFAWDRESVRELYRFGRWIFLSTAFTFLAGRLDQLMLARILGFTLMGVFSVAFTMSQVLPALMNAFTRMVGFPALSDLYRRDEVRFHWRLRQLRLGVIVPINAGLLGVAALGPWVIRLLYPEPYHDAGWMLTALAVGSLGGTVTGTYRSAMLAMGDSFRAMITMVSQFVLVIPTVLLGYHLAGTAGFIYGMASMGWLMYLIYMFLAIQVGIWQPKVDLPILLVCGAAGGWLLISGGLPI